MTDENGYYEVNTIMPEEYTGRPRHLHVKVRSSGGDELTSQLYWQLYGDEFEVTSSDIDSESMPCQVLTASEDDGVLRSSYDFFIK